MVMAGDGERKVMASALSAVSFVISKAVVLSFLRDTWQYGQECSQRRLTTKICRPVNSESRCILVRSLSDSRSRATRESPSIRKCLDFRPLYESERGWS